MISAEPSRTPPVPQEEITLALAYPLFLDSILGLHASPRVPVTGSGNREGFVRAPAPAGKVSLAEVYSAFRDDSFPGSLA